MPTYQYRCPSCGDYELSQRITEAAHTSCNTCGSPVERLISGGNFILKGSGWYTTDYARKGSSAAASSKSEGEKTSEAPKAEATTGHTCGGGCSHGAN